MMTDEEHDEMVLAEMRKELEASQEEFRNSKEYRDDFFQFMCSMASILKIR